MRRYSLTTVIKLSFDRALKETRQALQEEGFIVLTEIDLQAELARKLGQRIGPYTLLGVWVPSWEYQALQQEPDIALVMPSHVCLWDNGDGTCTLATPDLKHLCEAEAGSLLAEAARAVHARLRGVVASVQFTGAASALPDSLRRTPSTPEPGPAAPRPHPQEE